MTVFSDPSPDSSTISTSPDLTTQKLQLHPRRSQTAFLRPDNFSRAPSAGSVPSDANSASLSLGKAMLRNSRLSPSRAPSFYAKAIFSEFLNPQIRHKSLRHGQLSLIDITPGPVLARLKESHHGMVRVVEMFCGMAAWRAVTTADVTAREAEPQMNPRCAHSFRPLHTLECEAVRDRHWLSDDRSWSTS